MRIAAFCADFSTLKLRFLMCFGIIICLLDALPGRKLEIFQKKGGVDCSPL